MIATAQSGYNLYKSDVKEGGIVVIEPNLVKPTDEDRKKFKIYEIPIITIAKYEVGNVITQSVVALAIAVEFTKCMEANVVKEEMLSTVPEKTKAVNEKAFDLGIKYAKEALKA